MSRPEPAGPRLVGIVPAGGSGERLGADRPKAFVVLAGRAMLEWSVEVLQDVCDRVVVAVPEGYADEPGRVAGGPSRSASVRNAVDAAPEADVYVVHDAARPLLTEDLVRRCVDALVDGVDGAIAAAPVTDTIKHTDGQGACVSTLERSALWAVQTPAGVPRRGAAARAGRRRGHAGGRHRRRLAGRGGPAAGGRGGRPDRELQGDDAAGPADGRGGAGRAMLTDYHVHLRPDEYDATPAEYFTAENAERYRAAAAERGIAELGVSEHIHRFTAALDVWEHDWWRRNANDDIDAYNAFLREAGLKVGIEADLIRGLHCGFMQM